MKKILLSLAAVSMTAGAWAEATDYENFTDITPNYYKFNTAENFDVNEFVNTSYETGDGLAAFNFASKNAITDKLDQEGSFFTTERLANGTMSIGGFTYNNKAASKIAAGVSVYDFGGTIGKALVINGLTSDLAGTVKNLNSLDDEPNIPKATVAVANNLPLMFTLNHFPLAEDTYSRIRVKIELNAYTGDYTNEVVAMRELMLFPESAADKYVGESFELKFSDFADGGVWNPNRWLVLEEDFTLEDFNQGLYIKLATGANDGAIGQRYANGALLIRNIEIHAIKDDADSDFEEVHKLNTSWNEYSSTVGVSGIESEVNGEVEYFNLNGVKVVNPDKGIYIKKQGNKATKVIL